MSKIHLFTLYLSSVLGNTPVAILLLVHASTFTWLFNFTVLSSLSCRQSFNFSCCHEVYIKQLLEFAVMK